jgi:hypothetical protein
VSPRRRRASYEQGGPKRGGKLLWLLFGLAGLGVGVWVFRSKRRRRS